MLFGTRDEPECHHKTPRLYSDIKALPFNPAEVNRTCVNSQPVTDDINECSVWASLSGLIHNNILYGGTWKHCSCAGSRHKNKKHLFLVCTSSFGCSSVASAWLFIFAMTIDLHVMINVFFMSSTKISDNIMT